MFDTGLHIYSRPRVSVGLGGERGTGGVRFVVQAIDSSGGVFRHWSSISFGVSEATASDLFCSSLT